MMIRQVFVMIEKLRKSVVLSEIAFVGSENVMIGFWDLDRVLGI